MQWQELLVDGYGRIQQSLRKSLEGMAADDLVWRPKDDANSMGWLAWHLTRVQDHHVSNLMEVEQLYIRDGWHEKFGRGAEKEDIGFGHSAEDVASIRANAETLLGYHAAVYARSKGYLSTLSEADLDRELNEPRFQPLPTVGARLVSIFCDNMQHAGQLAYLRGLLKGKGWFGA